VDEQEIQDKLYKWLTFNKGHDLICPNAYLFQWESDLISCTRARYVHEYEIKISRSDFKADSKKSEKHQALETGERELSKWEQECVERNGNLWGRAIGPKGGIELSRPNYFWYVCPEKMIKPDEVPEYAGLLTFKGNYFYFDVIKKPKKLHTEKIKESQKNSVLEKLQFRYWNLRLTKMEQK